MRVGIFTILFICLYLHSCRPVECENEAPGGYEFELPVTISPVVDTFRMGDTITIESSFSNQVFERRTQKSYTLDSFLFYPATDLSQIDTEPISRNVLDYFEYLVIEGDNYEPFMFNSGKRSLLGQYSYNGSRYSLKFLLIPKRAGLYFLSQRSSLFPQGESQTFPGQCGKDNIDASMNVNNGIDNNKSFIFESPDSSLIIWASNGTGDRFADSGGYCFYVVE